MGPKKSLLSGTRDRTERSTKLATKLATKVPLRGEALSKLNRKLRRKLCRPVSATPAKRDEAGKVRGDAWIASSFFLVPLGGNSGKLPRFNPELPLS